MTVGDDDVIAAWDGAPALGLFMARVIGALFMVCRAFRAGAFAGFPESCPEALLCSLAEGELTRLLVSVSVSDCE